ARQNFNQSKNNRHQQTWHTIEFSNNRPPKTSPRTAHHKSSTRNKAIGKEELFLAAYRTVHTFRLSVSHPATQKTIHAPHPQRKSTPTTTQHTPKTPASPPSNIRSEARQ
ncbi:hypothetical protein, partial [Paenarthrobacter sp. YIM B13468]|uniref:hypothetical protein n=1 Tax=Paenarthrobacter sp. YIM B13468 TaxID=3366295 RepID=UPI00366AE678